MLALIPAKRFTNSLAHRAEIVRAARPRTRSSRVYQRRHSSLILSHVLAPHLTP